MNSVQALSVLSATLCAAAALWLVCARDEALRRARLMFADAGSPSAAAPGRIHWQPYAGWARAMLVRGRRRVAERLGVVIGPEALCLPAGLLLALLTRSPLLAFAGVFAMPCVRRRLRDRQRWLASRRWQEAVISLSTTVAGDLRAGRQPDSALTDAVELLRGPQGPGGPQAAQCAARLLAAARFGGDVPAALRQAALQPGAYGLGAVAACWEVTTWGGAGLADGLDRVAAAMRADRDQLEDLRAMLAGTRSTATLLALLPVFGVVLGWAMGAEPLRILLHTPAGITCLLTGALLETLGMVWTGHIVRAAEA